jgi:hypothetical protein
LGNIFKYIYVKKSAIFAENMKKVGVCRFKKSAIFAAIWGEIKN